MIDALTIFREVGTCMSCYIRHIFTYRSQALSQDPLTDSSRLPRGLVKSAVEAQVPVLNGRQYYQPIPGAEWHTSENLEVDETLVKGAFRTLLLVAPYRCLPRYSKAPIDRRLVAVEKKTEDNRPDCGSLNVRLRGGALRPARQIFCLTAPH